MPSLSPALDRMPVGCGRALSSAGIPTSSTAPRPSLPAAAWPIRSWSSPAPTRMVIRPPATSPPSSSRSRCRASRSANWRRSSGSEDHRPPSSSSKTWRFRRTTGLAVRARVSGWRCVCSIIRGRESRRRRWGSPKARSTWPGDTPATGASSGSPSSNSRGFSSCWPTWLPRSRPPGP